MNKRLSPEAVARYHRDGYHFPVPVLSRDEARVLGLLHHRNIIRVDDLTSINGQCAIVMEYLDGVDLKNYQSVVIWCEQFGVLISPADLIVAAR